MLRLGNRKGTSSRWTAVSVQFLGLVALGDGRVVLPDVLGVLHRVSRRPWGLRQLADLLRWCGPEFRPLVSACRVRVLGVPPSRTVVLLRAAAVAVLAFV